MKIIQEKNFNKAKEEIKKEKQKNSKEKVVFSSGCSKSEDGDKLNRKIIEKSPPDILLINLSNRKDFQKQRNSGFNQVMAKAAKSSGVKIGINFPEIINSSGKEKARILGRLQQNIEICKKNSVDLVFVSPCNIFDNDYLKKNKESFKSLGKVLGMPPEMAKNAFNNLFL